jgi:hypothetical protein
MSSQLRPRFPCRDQSCYHSATTRLVQAVRGRLVTHRQPLAVRVDGQVDGRGQRAVRAAGARRAPRGSGSAGPARGPAARRLRLLRALRGGWLGDREVARARACIRGPARRARARGRGPAPASPTGARRGRRGPPPRRPSRRFRPLNVGVPAAQSSTKPLLKPADPHVQLRDFLARPCWYGPCHLPCRWQSSRQKRRGTVAPALARAQ